MPRARASPNTDQALLCAPDGDVTSCHVEISFWRTPCGLGPSRPWQVVPEQVATPSCSAGAADPAEASGPNDAPIAPNQMKIANHHDLVPDTKPPGFPAGFPGFPIKPSEPPV